MLSSQFESALIYATRLHATQIRKCSKTPYISHLLSVTALVLEDGGSEAEAIAALLHDGIEDQGGDKVRQEIRQIFGAKVADIVENCTESDTIPKPPWLKRKKASIEKLRTARDEVRRVVMADKLHNARSTLLDLHRYGSEIWDRFLGGKERTLWFYRSLISAARESGTSLLADELERTVVQLENFD